MLVFLVPISRRELCEQGLSFTSDESNATIGRRCANARAWAPDSAIRYGDCQLDHEYQKGSPYCTNIQRLAAEASKSLNRSFSTHPKIGVRIFGSRYTVSCLVGLIGLSVRRVSWVLGGV